MSLRLRDVMFFAGGRCLERFGVPIWRMNRDHDVVETFTRASVATARAVDGTYRQVSSGNPRVEYVDLDGDGVPETPALLLDAAGQNELTYSNDFSNAAWVDNGGTPTESNVTSLFSGENARQWENPNDAAARGWSQVVGTLTGSPETFSVIIENVDATSTVIGIRDNTAPDWVGQCVLTWSSGAVATANEGVGSNTSVASELLTTSGPNGGAVYRISITATADNSGNSRRLYIYPTGTSQNALTAILHHAQHEEAAYMSSPIVTTASAVARSADVLTAPFYAPPQALTVYVKHVTIAPPALTDSSVDFLSIGGAIPVLQFDGHGSAYAGRFVYVDAASDSVQSTVAVADGPDAGDSWEACGTLGADGSIQTFSRVNGGTLVTAPASSALALISAWGTKDVTMDGPQKLVSAVIARGNHSLAEMAEVFG